MTDRYSIADLERYAGPEALIPTTTLETTQQQQAIPQTLPVPLIGLVELLNPTTHQFDRRLQLYVAGWLYPSGAPLLVWQHGVAEPADIAEELNLELGSVTIGVEQQVAAATIPPGLTVPRIG